MSFCINTMVARGSDRVYGYRKVLGPISWPRYLFIPAADSIVQMKRPAAAASQRGSSPSAPKDYVICELDVPDMADIGVASALVKVHWRASRDAAV
jgi:hypothetical protein